jgi:hypothetical protein
MAVGEIFSFEWVAPPDDMRADELRETCARLEIEVAGQYPTVVQDLKTGSIRRSIFVPLYPLAEWIAYGWWQFLQPLSMDGIESKSNSGRARARDRSRNKMRSAGDGYAWPNLVVGRDGDSIRVSWQADSARDLRFDVRYLASGTELVSLTEFREACSALVDAVIARLDEASIFESKLHSEWEALRRLDDGEVQFSDACGRLGLDPFSDGPDFASEIEDAFSSLSTALFDELIDAADPELLVDDLAWIASSSEQALAHMAAETERDLTDLVRGMDHVPPSESRPYEIGYQQARLVRSGLGILPTAPFSLMDFP